MPSGQSSNEASWLPNAIETAGVQHPLDAGTFGAAGVPDSCEQGGLGQTIFIFSQQVGE